MHSPDTSQEIEMENGEKETEEEETENEVEEITSEEFSRLGEKEEEEEPQPDDLAGSPKNEDKQEPENPEPDIHDQSTQAIIRRITVRIRENLQQKITDRARFHTFPLS
jgi:hypothetical protein